MRVSRTSAQLVAVLAPLVLVTTAWRFCAVNVLGVPDGVGAEGVWRLVPPPTGTTCGPVLAALLLRCRVDPTLRVLVARSQLVLVPLRVPLPL